MVLAIHFKGLFEEGGKVTGAGHSLILGLPRGEGRGVDYLSQKDTTLVICWIAGDSALSQASAMLTLTPIRQIHLPCQPSHSTNEDAANCMLFLVPSTGQCCTKVVFIRDPPLEHM